MSLTLQRASLALLPLVAVAPAAIQSPAYAPKDGSTLVKTFVLTMDTAIDDSSTTLNGDDSMAPDIESATKIVRKLKISDTIASCADGRPTQLTRSYDGLSMHIDSPIKMMGGAAGMNIDAKVSFEGSSPLEALGVAFTWEPDSEEYKRTWIDEEGNSEQLDGLDEDMDLRALLPSESVEVGDSWEVDPEAFINILFAGGDLAFEMESTGDELPQGLGDIEDQPTPRESWDTLGECSVTARLGESRSEGDRSLAVIEFEVDLEATLDNTEDVLEAMGKMVPGAEADVELANTDTFMEGKGELLWDLTAGHAVSLAFEGELTSDQTQRASLAFGGQEMAIESSTSSSGTVQLEIEVEAQ